MRTIPFIPLAAALGAVLVACSVSPEDAGTSGGTGESPQNDEGAPAGSEAPQPAAPGANTIDPGQGDPNQVTPPGASSPAVDLSLTYGAGTRLTPRVGVTPDGIKVFLGFRDTERKEDCTVQHVVEDGSIRCIPHRCGGTLTPSSHVSFSRMTGTTVGGLGVVDLVGADGSQMFDTLSDVTAGADCRVAEGSDGSMRCLPLRGQPRVPSTPNYYSDQTCTNPMASPANQAERKLSPGPLTNAWRLLAGPGARYEINALLPTPNATCLLGGANSCTSVSLGQCSAYRARGAVVPPTSFIATAAVPAGTTRVQPLRFGAGTGRVVRTGLFDKIQGRNCEVATASDGTLRCFPTAITSDYFSDASCTKPVNFYKAAIIAYDDSATCPPRRRTFSAGAEVTGAYYFRPTFGGSCVRYTAAGPNATGTYTTSATEIAPSALESLTLQ